MKFKKSELIFPKMEKVSIARKRRTEQLYSYLQDSPTKEGAELIKQCIRDGIYTGLRDNHQRTLLHLVAQRGNIALVRYLLDAGEDIEALDDRHETPLWKACRDSNNNEVVQELLSRGARFDICDKSKNYLFFSVTSAKIMKVLIRAGASLEMRDWSNATRLSKSTSESSLITILLGYGANVHAEDHKGITFLKESRLPHIYDKIRYADQLYAKFVNQGTPPSELYQLYSLLMIWPLSNPKMEVDRVGHMRQIFVHAKWPSKAAAEKIAKGLLQDKQIDIYQYQSLLEAAFPGQKQSVSLHANLQVRGI